MSGRNVPEWARPTRTHLIPRVYRCHARLLPGRWRSGVMRPFGAWLVLFRVPFMSGTVGVELRPSRHERKTVTL